MNLENLGKNKCIKCPEMAVWVYPGATDDSYGLYCDSCIPRRGCSCVLSEMSNDYEKDEDGKILPCVDYMYYKDGVDSATWRLRSGRLVNCPKWFMSSIFLCFDNSLNTAVPVSDGTQDENINIVSDIEETPLTEEEKLEIAEAVANSWKEWAKRGWNE